MPRTTDAYLACDGCGSHFEFAPLVFGCPSCLRANRVRVLEVHYRRNGTPPPPWATSRRSGSGRYADLLPRDGDDGVSLGEGGTPLIRSRVVGPRVGLRHLYFKNETVNPTWSFKDRYVAVTINVARQFGYRRTVVSSTGNLGASTAAYSAAAGLACLFIAPPDASPVFLDQARLHGAHVFVTTWDGRQPIFEHLARARGCFPVGLFLPRPVHNPFGVEGYKAFAYEVLDTLRRPPAAMLFPCARGNGLYGAWKGFREAQAFGWTESTPAMVACQPVGANSLEVSLQTGSAEAVELPQVQSVALSTKETVADTHALAAIRVSGGTALSATDAEILQGVRDLGQEGLCVEASSALPVACLPKLLASSSISPDDPIVCVLTAAGIKWPGSIAPGAPPLVQTAPDLAAIDRHLAELGLLAGA